MVPSGLAIEQFAGDWKALTMAKMDVGTRILSQAEKMQFFAIADGKMKDGMKEIRKMAGIEEPGRRSRRRRSTLINADFKR